MLTTLRARFFFFNDTATTEIYTLSLHDALPIYRNGLRPCRYKITRDGLVVAGSEVGLVDLDPAEVVESGSLGPGELLVVDTRRKAVIRNAAAKHEVARRRPYANWGARAIRRPRPAGTPDSTPLDRAELAPRQLAFGFGFADLLFVL